MTVSLLTLPVHSLQDSSEADLLRCFRSDEQRDSKLNFDFSNKRKRFDRKDGSLFIEGGCLLKGFNKTVYVAWKP